MIRSREIGAGLVLRANAPHAQLIRKLLETTAHDLRDVLGDELQVVVVRNHHGKDPHEVVCYCDVGKLNAAVNRPQVEPDPIQDA